MPNPSLVTQLSSTQAGGAVSATLRYPGGGGLFYNHAVQAEVTLTSTGAPATATAGTLSVLGRLPGAIGYQEVTVINLTAPKPVVFDGFYDSIEAVSSGLDADKTWTLIVVSGD